MKLLSGEVKEGDTVEIDGGESGLVFRVLQSAAA